MAWKFLHFFIFTLSIDDDDDDDDNDDAGDGDDDDLETDGRSSAFSKRTSWSEPDAKYSRMSWRILSTFTDGASWRSFSDGRF